MARRKEKKTKKRGGGINPSCLLLLLPALILGGYGILYEIDIIPREIGLGNLTVEFFALGENALMVLLAKACFIWLPVLCVALVFGGLIIGMFSSRRSSDEESEASSPIGDSCAAADGTSPEGLEKGESEAVEAAADAPESRRQNFAVLRRLELESRGAERRSAAVKEYAPVALKDIACYMREYAASKGVLIPEKTSRAILASIVSGRVIVTDDRQRVKSKAVVGALASYFGGEVHPHSVGLGCYAAEQLTTSVTPDNVVVETGFLIDIYSACISGDGVRLAYLEDLDPVAVSAFFSDYKEALEGGSAEKYVPVDKLRRGGEFKYINEGRVLFPENLTLVLAPTFGTDVTKLSGEAVYLQLSDTASCAPTPYAGVHGENAYPQLMKAAERAREAFYLSEGIWKKIDMLESYLNALLGYRFNNRKIRLMERYSSAYMAAGGGEAEALDSMLSSCVFNELYPKRSKFTVKDDQEDLVEFLERAFGAEAIPVSIEIVRKFYGASSKAVEASEKMTATETAETETTVTPEATATVTDTESEEAAGEAAFAEEGDTAESGAEDIGADSEADTVNDTHAGSEENTVASAEDTVENIEENTEDTEENGDGNTTDEL